MAHETDFRIFRHTPNDVLSIPHVAPALQAVETAFHLVAFNRWQSAIALLGGSCELLLRGKYDSDGSEKIKFLDLINAQCRDKKITKDFAEQAHAIRKLRNEVMHKGLAPKDDVRCIESFYFDTMPYLKKILKENYGVDLWALANDSDNDQYNWVSDIQSRTAKAIHLKKKKKKLNEKSIRECVLPLQEVFRSIFWTRCNSPGIQPIYSFRESAYVELVDTDSNLEGRAYEIKRADILKALNIVDLENEGIEFFSFCSICRESLIAAVDNESGTYEINGVGCSGCGYTTKDVDLCKLFCTDNMSDKDRVAKTEYVERQEQFKKEEEEDQAKWNALSPDEKDQRTKQLDMDFAEFRLFMTNHDQSSASNVVALFKDLDKDVFFE